MKDYIITEAGHIIRNYDDVKTAEDDAAWNEHLKTLRTMRELLIDRAADALNEKDEPMRVALLRLTDEIDALYDQFNAGYTDWLWRSVGLIPDDAE